MIPGVDRSVDIDVLLRSLPYNLDQLRRCLCGRGVIHRRAALGEEWCGHDDAAQEYHAQGKACRVSGSADSFAHYNFFLACFAAMAMRSAAACVWSPSDESQTTPGRRQ